jgi:hypothetical protein
MLVLFPATPDRPVQGVYGGVWGSWKAELTYEFRNFFTPTMQHGVLAYARGLHSVFAQRARQSCEKSRKMCPARAPRQVFRTYKDNHDELRGAPQLKTCAMIVCMHVQSSVEHSIGVHESENLRCFPYKTLGARPGGVVFKVLPVTRARRGFGCGVRLRCRCVVRRHMSWFARRCRAKRISKCRSKSTLTVFWVKFCTILGTGPGVGGTMCTELGRHPGEPDPKMSRIRPKIP